MARVYATPSQVAEAVSRYSSGSIPVGYYIGTADHEGGFEVTNVYPEKDAAGNFLRNSYGLFQVDDEEAGQVGLSGAACVDPVSGLDNSARVFVHVSEQRFQDIISNFTLTEPFVWVVLAAYHNMGRAGAFKIAQTGDYSYFNRHGYADAILNAVAWSGAASGLNWGLLNIALGRTLSLGEILFLAALGGGAALGVTMLARKYG